MNNELKNEFKRLQEENIALGMKVTELTIALEKEKKSKEYAINYGKTQSVIADQIREELYKLKKLFEKWENPNGKERYPL